MNKKVNNTSERLHLNNTILSEAQCGEVNNTSERLHLNNTIQSEAQCGEVNNTSERLHLNLPDPQGNGLRSCGANTIQSEAQCGEQCGDPLEELMIAWQQHSDRIDQIAGQHDLSHIRLVPRLFVLSSRRRRVLSSLAMALVCLAAIAGMVMLRRHLISDILEQLFLVFLALLVVVALFHSLLQLFPPHRQPQLNFQFSILNSQFSILSRAAVFASVVAMFLFLAVPVQNGRAMSHGSPSHRSATLTCVSSVLSHIQ